MRSAKVTRLRLVFEAALHQRTNEIEYTLRFLVRQATHFLLPLFPQGLFAAFLGLEISDVRNYSELYRALPARPDRGDDFFRGT